MKEARYFYVPSAVAQSSLTDDEAKHAMRVLRMHSGDEMFLLDGEGGCYRAEVTDITQKHCDYRILETIDVQRTWHGSLHLAVAPTKMIDRMEWFAEKATEIGFDCLSFLNCDYSERRQIRIDRIERIVVSAMKQSRKPWKPMVNDMMSFKDFVRQPQPGRKYIAHCYNEIERIDLFNDLAKVGGDTSDDVTVLIGPEGDFSIDEVRLAIDCGYVSVGLGQSRLRTETAALSAVMMMQLARRI